MVGRGGEGRGALLLMIHCIPSLLLVGGSFFETFTAHDFAKAGFVAPRTILLEPMEQPLQYFPITMFDLFRK